MCVLSVCYACTVRALLKYSDSDEPRTLCVAFVCLFGGHPNAVCPSPSIHSPPAPLCSQRRESPGSQTPGTLRICPPPPVPAPTVRTGGGGHRRLHPCPVCVVYCVCREPVVSCPVCDVDRVCREPCAQSMSCSGHCVEQSIM